MSPDLIENFKIEYNTCLELLSLAKSLPADHYATDSLYERLLLGFFAKDLNTYQSILSLCENGFGESALILCRVLLEDVINLEYIGLKPEERSTLFVEYQFVEKKRVIDTLRALNQPINNLVKTAKETWWQNYERVKENYPDETKWAYKTVEGKREGLSLWEMAKKVGATDPYRLVYPYASRLIHGTAAGLDLFLAQTEPNQISLKLAPSPEKIDLVLPMAFYLFLVVTTKFTEKFVPSRTSQVKNLQQKGQTIFEQKSDKG